MFDRKAAFTRATAEGDNDFAAFGQAVLSVELNHDASNLLYRCWHLRDVTWVEGIDGSIGTVYRKWVPYAVNLAKMFPGKLSTKAAKAAEKDPYSEIAVRHAIIPADDYDGPKKTKLPYWSVYFEVDTGQILEEIPTFNKTYCIPRWQTVSGSQYSYSPATVSALPDARLIQAMTLTLLEAGEKAVNPPLVATQEVVRSDVQVFAGGITWVDAEYDERLGEALRPMTIDTKSIPLGIDLRNDIKEMISRAFFLDKLNLPPAGGPDMTAYEVGQRVQEYIRNALPLFGPMEMEYNASLCELTFEVLQRGGAFGDMRQMPQSLMGQEVQFRFESPLHDAVEKQKGQIWLEAKGLLADAAAIDPNAPRILDAKFALRDALTGVGTPANWLRSEEDMDNMEQAANQQQAIQQTLANLQQGGAAAEQIGKAGQALNGVTQNATAP